MNESKCLYQLQYYRHAFGSLPAFIFSWVCTLVLKPSQLAIICLAFAKYTVEAFVSECEPPIFIIQILCVAIIGTNPTQSCNIY
jgi:L-type amino acid transporter 9